jgi:aconitate hydratase
MNSTPALRQLAFNGRNVRYVPISDVPGVDALPFTLRVLLENLLRQRIVRGADVEGEVQSLLQRRAGDGITFYPARVFGQDILGLVMLLDMAAMRDAVEKAGGDPSLVSPQVPIDVIIDHSLQVDSWANPHAARINLAREYERNGERFAFLRWCASSLPGVHVVPPGKGIMHQLHLESIGRVVWADKNGDGEIAYPDSCVGTDSHTPMVNGLGILGWGVGGIEAEAVMLGQPVTIALPEVLGVEVKGALRDGVLPTDLVLVITEKLRQMGVVGKFVEFFGPGLDALSLGDRGMIANMAPEYGATVVYFPVDRSAIDYLRTTGRPEEQIALVEAYSKAQKLWRDEHTPNPTFETVLTLDLDAIKPSIAGPRNPEDRLDLDTAPIAFKEHHQQIAGRPFDPARTVPVEGAGYALHDGAVVIAAITSCTNTANPVNMMAAGLVAQKAVARGLRSKPWVKTSLVPGSQVTADVLVKAGLQSDLDKLGFHIAGFGCTTCNGGSGPLPKAIVDAIESEKLVSTAVLSGNRNFEGRIHPNVRAAYLASPALVVAYALAGSLTVDITREPIGYDPDGQPVHLRDIWPSAAEIAAAVEGAYGRELFQQRYAELYEGGEPWDALAGEPSDRFNWDDDSTYIRKPPYFDGLGLEPEPVQDIVGMRPLAILGDSITTDHISPSGAISLGTPAADFLLSKGVQQADFNNYTTRRANHEVAVRATFANIRLRNRMVPGVEGGVTKVMPDGDVMRIFEAAQEYLRRDVPLVVVAGQNYGCGSSRDWAAKGVALLGVKAVIAEGFERIHRTNLVGMGVLPLQFLPGTTAETLGLDGTERFDIIGLEDRLGVRSHVDCVIHRPNGDTQTIPLEVRLDTTEDVEYWRHGGILPRVWRGYVTEYVA